VTTRSESETWNSDQSGPTIDDVPSPFHLLRVDGQNTPLNIAGRAGNLEEIGCDDVRRAIDDLMAELERPALICD
jgi:hypothetical protein